jgi:energy-coupling factor transporter transmembrane protein EcfT
VLFARSAERADGIYRAMAARGFSGHFSLLSPQSFRIADFAFLFAALVISAGIRLAL